jgi:biotin transporter BioY
MLLGILALRRQLDSTTESFNESSDYSSFYTNPLLTIFIIIIFTILYSYGSARLSYFYNMNNGNPGFAIFYSVLAFIFADFYYPMYSFFLNPQSARGRNNIPLPAM